MPQPEVERGAVEGSFRAGDVAVAEGAAAEGDDQDALGQGGQEVVIACCEGVREETARDRVAALEGDFGGGQTGADLP